MSYKLAIRKEAHKYLAKNPQLKKRVVEWLKDALDDPYSNHDGTLKGIADDEPIIYKKRIGDYRVLFHVFDEQLVLEIIRIRPRGQAYKG